MLQYARVLPPALRQTTEVRRVALPPDEELLDPADLLPLRLGAGRFGAVPARLLGRFALAWWTRDLPQDAPFTVAPDTVPGGARPVAGESAGETPRRLPGVGVELLQLRDYVSGDALSRIDWKATARRGALVVARIQRSAAPGDPAGRSMRVARSRVRAGALDRLGLYANVAARLAEHAVSIEDRVGLLVYADRTLTRLPAGSRRARRGAAAPFARDCSRASAANPIRSPRRFMCGACCAIAAWSCGSRISRSPRATMRSCRR